MSSSIFTSPEEAESAFYAALARADLDGMIIHSLGDPAFVDRAQRVALQPGARWDEASLGTNGIGTALLERAPVEVFGSEHYLDRNVFLSCCSSPIFDPQGELAGVFDISGDYRNPQRHTMGLVRLSVQLVEKRLFESEFGKHIVFAFHTRPEYVGSLQEALIALGPDGTILGAHLLGNPASELIVNLGIAIEKNMTAQELNSMVFPHPTVGEIIKETLFT